MKYEEFSHINIIKDENNPFCVLYEYEDGSRFYIEPQFYTMLKGFEEHHREDYPRILKRMEEVVRRNKKVIFTADFEHPQTEADDEYIILEIFDITNPLQIFVEDKSRGSDYGD
ncbi:MAG: hypothetical protein IKB70_14375 [Bacilli bacterium]|nr:hypothetical protein [Bacilli bacterium]